MPDLYRADFRQLEQWLVKLKATLLSSSTNPANGPPDNALELSHLERMLKLLQLDEDVLSRNHFIPGHFTNSAFVVHRQELLLIHHQKLNIWVQPGGHVEPFDTCLLQGARREVAEETLLPLESLSLLGHPEAPVFDVDIHEIPARKNEPKHFHFDVRFLFQTNDATQAGVGDGVKDMAWVPFHEVKNYQSDESVMRAVAKLM